MIPLKLEESKEYKRGFKNPRELWFRERRISFQRVTIPAKKGAEAEVPSNRVSDPSYTTGTPCPIAATS